MNCSPPKANDLLEFWKPVVAANGGVHPQDLELLQASHHGFPSVRIPEPWFGDPRKATVYFLTLNPGHKDEDDRPTSEWTKFCLDMLGGNGTAKAYLDSAPATALRWYQRCYGAFTSASGWFEKICNLRLVPYPSPNKNDFGGVPIHSLPSVQLMKDFVQGELKPRALNGEIALLVLRSPVDWGFERLDQDFTEQGLFISKPVRNVSILLPLVSVDW